MGLLIDGEWRSAPPAQGDTGDFVRQTSTVRHQVTADGSSGFKAEPGRYHLYVSRACPWCHRTMIYRVLKRLENIISVGFVEPTMREQGWTFRSPIRSPARATSTRSISRPTRCSPVAPPCPCYGTRKATA